MRSKSKPSLADYLRFRAFIAPAIATLIWLLGVIAITIFTWASEPVFGTFFSIVVFIASNTLWRLAVEFWVVLFSIHAAIKEGSGHNKQEETVEPPSTIGPKAGPDPVRAIAWVALALIVLVAIGAGIDVLSILLYRA